VGAHNKFEELSPGLKKAGEANAQPHFRKGLEICEKINKKRF